jgi:hypothetical protein
VPQFIGSHRFRSKERIWCFTKRKGTALIRGIAHNQKNSDFWLDCGFHQAHQLFLPDTLLHSLVALP